MESAAEYAQKRERQLHAQRLRVERARRIVPGLQSLLDAYAALQAKRGMAVVHGEKENLARFDEVLRQNEHEQAALLARHGLDGEYLALQYDCPLCRDYGFVGKRGEKPCVCYEQNIFAQRSKESNLIGFAQENFECFDLNIFPEENDQRQRMEALRRTAQEYADRFPHNEKTNLLLLGSAGLGKSYLLNCIGQRVLKRGLSVQKITANQFQQMILRDVFDKKNPGPLRRLETASLLIFDDLGSEPGVNELIGQYFYALLCERVTAQRPWVMASNLTVQELQARYGERTMSRLLDVRHTRAIKLWGKDVRLCRS